MKGTFFLCHSPQMAMFNFNLTWTLSLLHLLTLPICTSQVYRPATCFSPIKPESITLEKWVFSAQGLCVNKPHFFNSMYIFTPAALSLFPARMYLNPLTPMDQSEGGNVDSQIQAVLDQDRRALLLAHTEELWSNHSFILPTINKSNPVWLHLFPELKMNWVWIPMQY